MLKRRFPVHVTWRMMDGVWNLRTRRCFGALSRAFWGGANRFGFRLVHYSVQGNHVHLLVEAEDEKALSRGMKGLGVRVAKGLNRVMGRQGKVLDDRYHGHILRTPTEVQTRAGVFAAERAAALWHGGARSVHVGGGGDRAGYVLDAAVVLATSTIDHPAASLDAAERLIAAAPRRLPRALTGRAGAMTKRSLGPRSPLAPEIPLEEKLCRARMPYTLFAGGYSMAAKKKTAAKKTAKKSSGRKPNAAFMKPMQPDAQLGDRRRRQGDAAHRADEEALGVHQEEGPAGLEEPPHDQRRRQRSWRCSAARSRSRCSR